MDRHILRAGHHRGDDQQHIVHQGGKKDGESNGSQHHGHTLGGRRTGIKLAERTQEDAVRHALLLQFLRIDMTVEHFGHRLQHIVCRQAGLQEDVSVEAVAAQPLVVLRPSGNSFEGGKGDKYVVIKMGILRNILKHTADGDLNARECLYLEGFADHVCSVGVDFAGHFFRNKGIEGARQRLTGITDQHFAGQDVVETRVGQHEDGGVLLIVGCFHDHLACSFTTGSSHYTGDLGFHAGGYAATYAGEAVIALISDTKVLLDSKNPVGFGIEIIVRQLEADFSNEYQSHCQAYAQRQYLNIIMSALLEQGAERYVKILHCNRFVLLLLTENQYDRPWR